MKIALVTCRELPEPDRDEELLLDALSAAGGSPTMLPWDGAGPAPASFDRCVLRSCWNYPERPEAFFGWVEKAAAQTRLINGLEAVRWNFNKRYLSELEAAGVPVVPTHHAPRGSRVDLTALRRELGWDEVVIKPAVSAGSYRTRRFGDDMVTAQRFLDELTGERDALIQRFMNGFDEERALVQIDGVFTHAAIKSPRFDDGDERVSDARPIEQTERALAERAIACAPGPLVYARVDAIEHDGALLVSEVELMEPSLFLLQHPPALQRLVAALLR